MRNLKVRRQFFHVNAELHLQLDGDDLALVGGVRQAREDDEEAGGAALHHLDGVLGDDRVVDVKQRLFQGWRRKKTSGLEMHSTISKLKQNIGMCVSIPNHQW